MYFLEFGCVALANTLHFCCEAHRQHRANVIVMEKKFMAEEIQDKHFIRPHWDTRRHL